MAHHNASSEKILDDKRINQTFSAAPLKMPRLPAAYSVVLEINRVRSKETVNVREYIDFENQRIRTEVHDEGQLVTVIRDWNTTTKYVMVNDLTFSEYFREMNAAKDSICTKESLDVSAGEDYFSSKTRHMKSPHEIFMFSSNGEERYIGEDYARGIKCTQWYAEAEEVEVRDGHTLTVKSKRNHWFSAPDWSDANCAETDCLTQIPIRTVSEGTVFNHTSRKRRRYHDHYEYTAFMAGAPAPHLFEPESEEGSGIKCPTAPLSDFDNLLLSRFGTVSTPASHGAVTADSKYSGGDAQMMPMLPEAYTAVLEINRVNAKTSLSIFEHFDFRSQRVRTDVHSDGRSVSVIRDHNTKIMYTIIDEDEHGDPFVGYGGDDLCFKTQLVEPMHSYTSATLHLRSPSDVFMFEATGAEQFLGFDYARGIKCTQWHATSSETKRVGGHNVTVKSTRNHWFSAPDWSDAGCSHGSKCNLEVPVRVVSEGTVFNHTSGETSKFHDHYEYMSFIAGKPPQYVFAPSMNCAGTSRGSSEQSHEDSTLSRGSPTSAPRLLPQLPSAYSVVVEMSRVESLQTLTVTQYYDTDDRRIRTDVHNDGKVVSVIRDFDAQTKYILSSDVSHADFFHGMNARDGASCVKEPLDMGIEGFSGITRHNKNPHDVFLFEASGEERYIGFDYARGIKCTQWYAEAEEVEVRDGHTLTVKSKRNHWFSAPDWSDAGCTTGEGRDCFLELPIRTVSEGTVFNHTSGKTSKFHDHYEFTAFMPGRPSDRVFSPEGDVNCSAAPMGSTSTATTFRDEAPRSRMHVPSAMPALPAAYTSILEINKVATRETTNVREYFDFNNNLIRTDVFDDGKLTTVVQDFGHDLKHTITDSDVYDDPYTGFREDDQCTTTRIEDDMYVASKTRHMKSPHEKFMFSPEGNSTYIGFDYARGIKCTQWYAEAEEVEVRDGHTLTVKSKRNHWFSAPDWSDANCVTSAPGNECATQSLARIVSEGTVFNHTSGKTSKFHDHYEYMSFVAGKPPLYLFDASDVCEGAAALGTLGKAAPPFEGTSTSPTIASEQTDSANLRSSSVNKPHADGLAGGTIAGIAVFALVAVTLVAVVIRRATRPRSRSFELMDDNGTTAGVKARRAKAPVVQSSVLKSPLSPTSPANHRVQVMDSSLATALPTSPDPNADRGFENFV